MNGVITAGKDAPSASSFANTAISEREGGMSDRDKRPETYGEAQGGVSMQGVPESLEFQMGSKAGYNQAWYEADQKIKTLEGNIADALVVLNSILRDMSMLQHHNPTPTGLVYIKWLKEGIFNLERDGTEE